MTTPYRGQNLRRLFEHFENCGFHASFARKLPQNAKSPFFEGAVMFGVKYLKKPLFAPHGDLSNKLKINF